MSIDKNVKLVRSIYDAYGRSDLEFVLSTLADNIDWQLFIPNEIPYSGRYRGVDQVRQFFALFGEFAEIQQFEIHEYLGSDNAVTVLGWDKINVKPTGRSFEMNWAHVYNIESEKVVRFREYFDTVPLIEAFRNA